METQTKRRSRWKKPPLLKSDGTKRKRAPTQKDEEILQLLTPGSGLRRPWGYSLLRSNYISTLLSRDHSSALESLDALTAAGGYLYLPEQPVNNFRHLVYALSEKGAKHIDQPRPRHIHLYRHELMSCDIAASFEVAARRHGANIFAWPALYSSDQFPEATRDLKNPMAIPVGNRVMRADWEPFVFKADKFTFLPGFEADTGTEPLDSADRTRSSIRQKFEDYLTVIDTRTYRSHFGATSFFVPFIVMLSCAMSSAWPTCCSFSRALLSSANIRARTPSTSASKSFPAFTRSLSRRTIGLRAAGSAPVTTTFHL